MSPWVKTGPATIRRSPRSIHKSTGGQPEHDATSDDGENDHVKTGIPGDYDGNTRRSINGTYRLCEQKPKAKQSESGVNHHPCRPVCPEITSSTPGAWREESSSSSEEEEVVKEAEDIGEVSGAVLRCPSPGSVQYSCSEPGASCEPPPAPEKGRVLRPSAAYTPNEPIKPHSTSDNATVKHRCQRLTNSTIEEVPSHSGINKPSARISIVTLTVTHEEITIPSEYLHPNYNSSSYSSGYESDSGSDSDRASIFSEDISYDTPAESNPDRPSKELTTRPPQSRAQGKPNKAFPNDGIVTVKYEATAPCGNGWRVIMSIKGSEGARIYRIQPGAKHKDAFSLGLPEVQSKLSRDPQTAIRVCGVAFSGDGPEVMDVGEKARKPQIYVNFLWDDGTNTWENGTTARALVKRLMRRGMIIADLTPHQYLCSVAVESEKEFLKANPGSRHPHAVR